MIYPICLYCGCEMVEYHPVLNINCLLKGINDLIPIVEKDVKYGNIYFCFEHDKPYWQIELTEHNGHIWHISGF